MLLPLLFVFPILFLSCFVSAATPAVRCFPSESTICVSHDGIEFVLEGGVSNHSYISSPTPKPLLAFFQGWKYTFQLTENGDFATHPLILTSDPTGGCVDSCGFPPFGLEEDGSGTAGNGLLVANQPGAILEFTANLPRDIGQVLYYQCDHHLHMGNEILIVNASTYSVTNAPPLNNTSFPTNTTTPTVFLNVTEIFNGSSTGIIIYESNSTGVAVGGGGTGGGGTGGSATGGAAGTLASTGGQIAGGGSTGGTTGSSYTNPNGGLMKSSVNWIVGGTMTLITAIMINLL